MTDRVLDHAGVPGCNAHVYGIPQGEHLLAMGVKFLDEASAARSILEKQADEAKKEVRTIKSFRP